MYGSSDKQDKYALITNVGAVLLHTTNTVMELKGRNRQ